MSPIARRLSAAVLVAVASLVMLAAAPPANANAAVTDVQAFVREGQTFITWKEATSR